jgi:release factor glutamine methyltransferase
VVRKTVGSLLEKAAARLAEGEVPSPADEAGLLLSHFLGTDRGGLVVRGNEPFPGHLERPFLDAVERRAAREPFQYIVGRQEFYGRSFLVDPRVLIPRPETELLIDRALDLLPEGSGQVADLGTGSGCIAVTLAAERGEIRVDALDLCRDALDVATENAKRHEVEDRIRFRQGDLEELPGSWSGRFDLVVSNPPYVTPEDWSVLAPEVRDHEPRRALVPESGPERIYAALSGSACHSLKEDGIMLLELGYDSEAVALRGAAEAGFRDLQVFPDFQGIGRVLAGRKGKRG